MASIFSRVGNILKKNFQNTNTEFNKIIYNYLGQSIVWNPENDDTYIKKGYMFNSTVYSIVNLIAKTASNIPFQVYEVKNQNELKKYKAMTSGLMNGNILHKSLLQRKHALAELDNTDLHKLLERPNPAQSYSSWIQEIIAFGKLTGNRYVYGIKPESGPNQNKWQELYILPSQSVEINSNGIFEPVSGYSLDYSGQYKIDAEDICHIKDFNPYYDGTGSHLYGMSPLKAGLRSLDTNNEAVTTGVKYLQNQTSRGVLMSDEGDLNEVQAQQLKDKFRQQYQGSDNAGDIIITPKKLSWVNFGLNATDVSLIQQYNASIKDLCNIYQVPVQLLNNTDTSTYNNMIEAKKSLYQNAVIPELNKIKDELNRWLVPAFGENLYLDFDYSNIAELQEEMDSVVKQMGSAWWTTPNEKRQAMNYGVDEENEEMNDYYIPANLMPLSNDVIEEEIKSINIDYNNFDKGEIRTDVFDNPGEANARAQEIGCSGLHSHEENGRNIFMPCATHEEYERRIGTELKPGDNEYTSKQDSYNNYPQGATNNAKRMLEWRKKYGRDVVKGGTEVGWKRANQLANRESLSIDTIKRVNSFLARHEDNAKISEEYRNEPWKDRGYVAYNLWGGKSMVAWAKRISERDDS